MQFKLKFKKVFNKGWTNHDVWNLINAGGVRIGRLKETIQERKKLPRGTELNSLMQRKDSIERKMNNVRSKYEVLENDGEI